MNKIILFAPWLSARAINKRIRVWMGKSGNVQALGRSIAKRKVERPHEPDALSDHAGPVSTWACSDAEIPTAVSSLD